MFAASLGCFGLKRLRFAAQSDRMAGSSFIYFGLVRVWAQDSPDL